MWRFLAVAWITYLLADAGFELYLRLHPAAPAKATYRIRSAGPTPALPWRELPTVEIGSDRRPGPGDGATASEPRRDHNVTHKVRETPIG